MFKSTKKNKPLALLLSGLTALSMFSTLGTATVGATDTTDTTETQSVVGVSTTDFIYDVNVDGTAKVVNYVGKSSYVEVPEVIDGHTVEGVLLGHLVMGAEDIGRKCDELGIPSEKKYLLQHMIASHHGKPEFGAAVRPGFIEAEVLSQIDLLDANMYEMADAVKDVKPGEFTGRLWMLDNRRLYNHGRVDVKPQANLIDEGE